MNKLALMTSLALSFGVLHSVGAAPRWHENESHIAHAKVVSVTPIYETIETSRPEQRCWQAPVRPRHRLHHQGPFSGSQSYTGTIAGAIAGGAVGNQFGKGNGKDAMTVAGALLGASIGNDLTRAKPYAEAPRRERFEQRCETVENYTSREELVAYKVKYRLHGQTYTTRMDHEPGNKIRVRVSVNPVL